MRCKLPIRSEESNRVGGCTEHVELFLYRRICIPACHLFVFTRSAFQHAAFLSIWRGKYLFFEFELLNLSSFRMGMDATEEARRMPGFQRGGINCGECEQSGL